MLTFQKVDASAFVADYHVGQPVRDFTDHAGGRSAAVVSETDEFALVFQLFRKFEDRVRFCACIAQE